jgi:hypothetical protein
MLRGRIGLFADANPLAQLIARVKTRPIAPLSLDTAFHRVYTRYRSFRSGNAQVSVVNIDYWFETDVICNLGRIKRAIELEPTGPVKDFLLITFSGACKKVSNADPKLSVPVKLKIPRIPVETWEVFSMQFKSNAARMAQMIGLLAAGNVKQTPIPRYVGDDARNLKAPKTTISKSKASLDTECVSLIITSPPYAGAQKYVRSSSLNIGWLGLADVSELRALEEASIGREHFAKGICESVIKTEISAADRLIEKIHKINPLRATIVATYLLEMRAALSEMYRVLKPGGHLVLVIGNNEVCGFPFLSSVYLAQICTELGLQVKLRLIDEIKSRGLMTKRNKSASVITREWVLLFEKPEII